MVNVMEEYWIHEIQHLCMQWVPGSLPPPQLIRTWVQRQVLNCRVHTKVTPPCGILRCEGAQIFMLHTSRLTVLTILVWAYPILFSRRISSSKLDTLLHHFGSSFNSAVSNIRTFCKCAYVQNTSNAVADDLYQNIKLFGRVIRLHYII